MFVMNPVTYDSRVLREAATLADAGHEVTVMGTTPEPGGTLEAERVDGFTVIRVPRPIGWLDAWRRTIVSPWSLRRRSVGRITSGVREGRVGEVARGAGAALASLVVSGIRRAWLAVAGRAAASTADAAAWPPETLTFLADWRFGILGWARAAAAEAPAADIHHGHDLTGLPAAIAAAEGTGARIVYDSHEIFLESGRYATRARWLRWVFGRVERRWSRRSDALITVNHAYADVLRRRLRPRRTVVVHNCPPRWRRPDGAPDRLREAAGIPAGDPVVLYHGVFTTGRGLEELAAACEAIAGREADRQVHLAYLGYGGQRPTLERLAEEPSGAGHLHVLDAVPPSALLDWIATANVDAIPLQRTSLNHWLCTPNKLFESIAAGVPVVVSDFPEMRRIVLDEGAGPLGAVCDPAEPASIAAAIRSILDLPPGALATLRDRCRAAADARWNWETESQALLALYAELSSGLSQG